MESYKIKLQKVNTFIFDVDGVFTNGQIILHNQELLRSFNAKDGYAVQYAVKMGYRIFIITGGDSTEVKRSLLNLGATEVHLQSRNKLGVYKDLLKRHNIKEYETLYMGDDIPDLPIMKHVGVSCCPQDAAIELLEGTDYQSPYNGGCGCVRDVIEQTLRLQKKWLSPDAYAW